MMRSVVSSFNTLQEKICAIIVTYNPSFEALSALIDRLVAQVGAILILDNSPSGGGVKAFCDELNISKLFSILLNANHGLGAYNDGIKFAELHGYQYALLLDDDTLPLDNMVSTLSSAYLKLSASSVKVAAVGPRIVDVDRRQEFPFSYLPACFMKRDVRYKPAIFSNIFKASYLITSGTFVNIKRFQEVGKYKSSWFLYHIDTEWCTRAIKQGYQCFGIGDATLYHRMGEKLRHFNIFGLQIFLPIYPPERLYNIFRNEVWLIKCGPLSYVWSVVNLCKRVFLYALFTQPRLSAWKMICMGLKDGLLKKPLD